MLDGAELLERYPPTGRGPSALVLGPARGGRALHAAVGYSRTGNLLTVAVYEPTTPKWRCGWTGCTGSRRRPAGPWRSGTTTSLPRPPEGISGTYGWGTGEAAAPVGAAGPVRFDARGNLLGNQLCAIANLLNGGSPLTSLTQLLNELLAAL